MEETPSLLTKGFHRPPPPVVLRCRDQRQRPDAGLISILDLRTGSEIGRLLADPGVTDIEISRDGEWGVAVNPEAEKDANQHITALMSSWLRAA